MVPEAGVARLRSERWRGLTVPRTVIQHAPFDPPQLLSGYTKQKDGHYPSFRFGAGSGGRTRTVSLPLDFESSTSANSIIPAIISAISTAQDVLYHTIFTFASVF